MMDQENIFKKQGYVKVENILSRDIVDIVTQYALFDEMQDMSPERVAGGNNAQVPNAHSKYADPLMETVLLHVRKTLEENTGLELSPTYSYFRVYRNGDELIPHKDRPACEISTTICFGYSYDDVRYNWPIFVEDQAVDLKPGDAVIYRGCDLRHWREVFTPYEKSWHVQGFFHYVDKNGPHADWAVDKRESYGVTKAMLDRKPYVTRTKTDWY